MESVRKIFAVSLLGKQRCKAYAAYNGEILVVQSIQGIQPGPFMSWKDPLIDEIILRKARGFYTIVEERSDPIARHADARVMFDEHISDEQRIALYLALDWYFALNDMDLIILPSDCQQHTIREQVVDRQQDERGRLKYLLDWTRFTGGNRALLACVWAAVYENVNDDFLETVYGPKPEVEERYNALKTIRAITIGVDQAKREWWDEFDKGRE